MKLVKRGFYYHYKHDPSGPVNNYAYVVVGISVNRDTHGFNVIYYPLYDDPELLALGADYYEKPLEEFVSYTIVDNQDVRRYERIEDEETTSKLFSIDIERKCK